MIDFYLHGHYQIKDNADDAKEKYLLDYPLSQLTSTNQRRYMPGSGQSQEFSLSPQLPIRLTKNTKLLQYVIPYLSLGYGHQKHDNPLYKCNHPYRTNSLALPGSFCINNFRIPRKEPQKVV